MIELSVCVKLKVKQFPNFPCEMQNVAKVQLMYTGFNK